MSKISDGFRFVWDVAVDSYEFVTDRMGRHPHIVFWLVLAYLVVRR